MNKREFMERLERYLGCIPAGDREEILFDYEEHFRSGVEEGKPEVEIAESLGDPDAIAKLFTDNSDQKNGETISERNVNEAVNLKHVVELASTTKICIQTAGIPIKVIPGEEKIVTVRLHGKIYPAAKLDLNVDQDGTLLTINVERHSPAIVVTYSRLQLDISLPHGYSETLVIKTVSGSARADGLNPGEFSFKSVSGGLLFEPAVTAGTVYRYSLNAVSGNIRVILPRSSKFKLNARSVSGKVESYFPLQKSGTNHFEGNTGSFQNTIDVKTISGGIQIYQKD